MKTFPGLSIIIVNWNLKEDTLACIDSLVEAGADVDQVFLVDNASSDGSVDALRDWFGPALHIIENPQNLGFAQGNNQGIQRALGEGAEWVLLMNNDTLVAPDFLVELKKGLQQPGQFEILSPLILYYDLPDTIWYLGDRLVPGTLLTLNPYRGRKDWDGLPGLMEVDFVSGCSMLVRREVFERVGLFDTSLFMYGEEVDFCWRARQAGYRMACVTSAKMWHKVSTSGSRDRPKTRYLRIRNQIRFYRKYALGLQLHFIYGFVLLRTLRIGLCVLIHKQPELLLPLLRGWRDGWYLPRDASDEKIIQKDY